MITIKLAGRREVSIEDLPPNTKARTSVMPWPKEVIFVDMDIPNHGKYRFSANEILHFKNGIWATVAAGAVTFAYMSRMDRAIRIAKELL